MKILTFIAPRIDAAYATYMAARVQSSLRKLKGHTQIDHAGKLGIHDWAALQKHICEAQPRYDFVIVGGDWHLTQVIPQNEGFVRARQPASTSLIALVGEVSAFQYMGLRLNGFAAIVDMAEHELSLPLLIEQLVEEKQRLRDELTAAPQPILPQAAAALTTPATKTVAKETPPPATPVNRSSPELLYDGQPLNLSHAARIVLSELVKTGRSNVPQLAALKVPNLKGRPCPIGRAAVRTHIIPEIQKALTEQKPEQSTAATPALTITRGYIVTLLDSSQCLAIRGPEVVTPAIPLPPHQDQPPTPQP